MLLLLCILIFVYNFGYTLNLLAGSGSTQELEIVYELAFVCGVVWWLQGDIRRSAVKDLYCLGVLVGVGSLIIIPYHLLKTRGAKGLIPLSALVGSYLLAYVAAAIVHAILAGR